MAENSQQSYPLAPANETPRSDAESSAPNSQSKELRRKKRIKCYVSLAVFAVFQTIIMLIFSLVILPVKTPKLRLDTVTVNNIATGGTQTSSPSFNMSIIAHVKVKNTNYGSYKYELGMLNFMYGGDAIVGQQYIPKASAKARSTKKVDLLVNLDSSKVLITLNSSTSLLGNDIDSGFVKLTSHSKLSGEVKMLLVVKKKKSAFMNCTMTVNLTTKAVEDLKCN